MSVAERDDENEEETEKSKSETARILRLVVVKSNSSRADDDVRSLARMRGREGD